MMSIQSKRELATVVAPRYRAAHGSDKEQILDEFVASTGYHRKYAIRVLNHPYTSRRHHKRHTKPRYGPAVKDALVKIWHVANCICAKRLVPALPDFVTALKRYGELQIDPEVESRLLEMSISTADRLLRSERRQRHGLGTTKPGTLLKRAIPIRTFADWDDARPGFLEVDLVAHCGTSTHGEYLNTLTLTGVTTGWTECLPLLTRSQRAVTHAIDRAQTRFPFPILGLDSDNGSEFINANLLRYCEHKHITFTRSRPYKKNDQAHVEQKNWSIVRQLVGYDRYEGRRAYRRLDALYAILHFYVNFFQPVMKLISKERVGSKVKKQYDTAKTPYQRILESDQVAEEVKQQLREQYDTLNPAALLRTVQSLQDALWQEARVRFSNEATIPPK
jgi:transposase InsO family protein